MDPLRIYRRFVYSQYFAEGLRITFGVLLPAFVAGSYGYLEKGIFIALGALCISITDNPGPIHHRRNGMLIACVAVGVMALLTGLSFQTGWLFLVVLPVSCFLFSMIGVYGARATGVGVSALLVMVMTTHQALTLAQLGIYVSLLVAGGLWYTLLSLLLNRLRPYKLLQQVLGEYAMAAAQYLRSRSIFYSRNFSSENAYQQLMHTQVQVQQKQDLAAELLYKTRGLVKESNSVSRVLMMMYLDLTELLERVMTAHFDYNKLHEYFDDTKILEEYRQLIVDLSLELENIGIALLSGQASSFSHDLESDLEGERTKLMQLRASMLQPKNLEGFISLRHILDSISDIAARIRGLHEYTRYEAVKGGQKTITRKDMLHLGQQDYSAQLLIDNLSWNSNIFRHSIRVALAAMVAYIIGLFWNLGHSYWILLTVIIILKPGFGLTRMRNKQRIVGTLAGTAAAGLILYLSQNQSAVLVLLTVFMIAGYSFMRWKYQLSVFFMTIYLMLVFHVLEPRSFTTIVQDRIVDTLIGCGLAFVATLVIPAVWEKVQMSSLLRQLMEKANGYYKTTAMSFTGQPFDPIENSNQRKVAWVALANLSDAFNRMLSDPKSQQEGSKEWHRIVVSAHMMISHTATLTTYAGNLAPEFINTDYQGIISETERSFDRVLSIIDRETGSTTEPDLSKVKQDDRLATRIGQLIDNRRQELTQGMLDAKGRTFLSTFKTISDQFYFIRNAVRDIEKITEGLRSGGVS